MKSPIETRMLTFEQALDHTKRNVHRFSMSQRTKMIAECHPGFLALMQYEDEPKKASVK